MEVDRVLVDAAAPQEEEVVVATLPVAAMDVQTSIDAAVSFLVDDLGLDSGAFLLPSKLKEMSAQEDKKRGSRKRKHMQERHAMAAHEVGDTMWCMQNNQLYKVQLKWRNLDKHTEKWTYYVKYGGYANKFNEWVEAYRLHPITEDAEVLRQTLLKRAPNYKAFMRNKTKKKKQEDDSGSDSEDDEEDSSSGESGDSSDDSEATESGSSSEGEEKGDQKSTKQKKNRGGGTTQAKEEESEEVREARLYQERMDVEFKETYTRQRRKNEPSTVSISKILKMQIVEDAEDVAKGFIVGPGTVKNWTVAQMLAQYVQMHSQANAKDLDSARMAAEFTNCLRTLFNRLLELALLYDFERPVFEEWYAVQLANAASSSSYFSSSSSSEPVPVPVPAPLDFCDAYGAEHLLRLCVKLEGVFRSASNLSEAGLMLCLQHCKTFVRWFDKMAREEKRLFMPSNQRTSVAHVNAR